MDLLSAASIAQRCQRNWSDDSVAAEDLDYIIRVCTTMPTKQNVPNYRLIVSGDRELNHRIAETAAYQPIDVKQFAEGIQNHQLLAPTVLLWYGDAVYAAKYNEPDHVFKEDLYNSVGISSGAAALCAASLGYRTGFCKCMEQAPLDALLRDHGVEISPHQGFVCALGIGLPLEGHVHTEGVYRGRVTHRHRSIDKRISITLI